MGEGCGRALQYLGWAHRSCLWLGLPTVGVGREGQSFIATLTPRSSAEMAGSHSSCDALGPTSQSQFLPSNPRPAPPFHSSRNSRPCPQGILISGVISWEVAKGRREYFRSRLTEIDMDKSRAEKVGVAGEGKHLQPFGSRELTRTSQGYFP